MKVSDAVQPPVRDYAIIGDCHGTALVSKAGSIDWCSLLRHDADPTFFRLLDRRGGFWDVVPEGLERTEREYLRRTNILRTRFVCAGGVFDVLDFMPVGRTRSASVHDYVTLNAPGWLVRCFVGVSGTVRIRSRVQPRRPDFSLDAPSCTAAGERIDFEGGVTLWGDGVRAEEGGAVLDFELSGGERKAAVLTRIEPLFDPRERVEDMLGTTEAFWFEWTEYSRYRGPYEDMVWRSALALKLLTYAPTGAMAAAATTSLPEEMGGGRNWDYRFCWIRDATFALFALSVLGYSGEGGRFSEFLQRRCLREGSAMRIMYGLDGEPFLPERLIEHLEGYHGSAPVRTGNEAADQHQLDVFGELFDWAELRTRLGGRLGPDERALLAGLADHVCRIWSSPDQGLWEVRSGPQDFTQGKAMAWVALDRAARLLGDRPVWRENRDAILGAIAEKGCAGDPPYLVQAFGTDAADAALLQVPLLGMPFDDALLARTVRAVEARLRRGDFVFRYRGEDGLDGDEGAFMITSFWLVEAMLVTGRSDEARALFERLLRHANDVGLYAEEIDVETGAFLGNFPQAFTHLALCSSAMLLHLHDTQGPEALRGTNTRRAVRLVGATQGAKALAFALLRNRRIRLRSSRRSILALSK